jgi:hypothetical protein
LPIVVKTMEAYLRLQNERRALPQVAAPGQTTQ